MSDGASGDGGAVLVVDDNPLITNVLRSLLTSAGFAVHISSSGDEAVNVLKRTPVDVVICDVMMPNMDGYEFHSFLRSQLEYSHIPFIFLTALSSESDVTSGKETGADDYLVKPFNPAELLSTVKGKVARSRALKRAAEAQYDGFRRRVIHTLSHEFRTPLVAINTGTELLLEQHGVDEDRRSKLLEAVRRGGQRLERLVNDFMVLQQIEAGVASRLFETRAAPHSLARSVNDFLETRDRYLDQPSEHLKWSHTLKDEQVWIYEPYFHDVLSRLLSNALKFRLNDPVVELVARRIERDLVVEIRDRGRGVDLQRLKEATDVFGQLDRDKLEQQGSGLGLGIACRYMRILSGRIEFENREGGGTTVAVYLPLWEPQ